MRERNKAIGEVECPIKNCAIVAQVFRFRESGVSKRSIVNRRYAGKLYGICSKHGRFAGDSGDAEMQAYILEHAKIWAPSAPAAPAEQPGHVPAAVEKQTAAKPSAKSKPQAARSSAPQAKPPAEPEQSKRKPVWGFFDE